MGVEGSQPLKPYPLRPVFFGFAVWLVVPFPYSVLLILLGLAGHAALQGVRYLLDVRAQS